MIITDFPGKKATVQTRFHNTKYILLIFFLTLSSIPDLSAQDFTEQTGISLTGVATSSVAWGDYDNDGDLDIVLTGNPGVSPYNTAKIYQNNGDNTFTEQTGISLTAVTNGSVAWGDYDNDGDLDILLAGEYEMFNYVTKIYQNNGNNSFTEQSGISLTGVSYSSVDWGDYDNDGDLDILLTGWDDYNEISKIYQNNGDNTFTEQTGISLTGVSSGSVAWGDYDNDGDLDILLTGGSEISKIYQNNGDKTFSEQTGISLTGVSNSSVAWGDYDNDGDLDILVTGKYRDGIDYYISKIYQNNGDNSFTEQTGISLTGVSNSTVAWGDYDNDGNLDILLTGSNGTDRVSKIYKNNGNNTFTEQTGISLTQVSTGSVAWGDYDNDGDLDILLTGAYFDGSVKRCSKIYQNNSPVSNNVPSPPTDLNTFWNADSVVISWNRAVDNETPQLGLSYNAYLYSEEGDTVWNSMSDIKTGYRRIPAMGNVFKDTTWTIKNLKAGQYFWSVQAVDHAFAGSSFAGEQSFNSIFSPLDDTLLTGIGWGDVAWGDYDNDGDLDILLTGNPYGGGEYELTKIYKNNGDNIFTEQTGISLTDVSSSATAWGDYDNDGDLDILLTGSTDTSYVSKIYQNNGDNTFTELSGISLTGVYGGSVAWGDYDNDGDLDILLTGSSSGDVGYELSKIYKNNGDNTFTEQAGISLTGVTSSSVAWGDYDKDGDLDILLAGTFYDGMYYHVTKIYKNNSDNTFTEQTGISLTGVNARSVAWGDYDNDGDLDILLTGSPGGAGDTISRIYQNNGDNSFTVQSGILLQGGSGSSSAWGDYDNDGDLDILLTAYYWDGTNNWISRIYKNNGDNTFSEQAGISLTGVSSSSVAWGDYDNDGDLDILLSGKSSSDDVVSKIYTNNISVSNSVPSAPTGLNAVFNVATVVLSWNKALDLETPQDGLTYNAYLYSENGDTIWNSMSNINNGYRRIPDIGNMQHDTCWTIKNLEPGLYYWSVQAIDHAFAGSPFAAQNCFYTPFTEQTGISLTGVSGSSMAWGDYDNDGDLDILLTGNAGGVRVSQVYQNHGDNTFSEVTGISLPPVHSGSVAWGDCDNDGDLDILLTGWTGGSSDYKSAIYRNNGDSTFTEQAGISITDVAMSSVDWGDYDNDGDLDILLAGETGTGDLVSEIYRNDEDNTFTEQTGITLTGVKDGKVAWGDYDNDGDLDILLTGGSSGGSISKIYRNNGDNTFTEQIEISLFGTSDGNAAWGDYNNDGFLDILHPYRIYKNNGDNSFTPLVWLSLPGLYNSATAWGDYDNDGDLDVLLTGEVSNLVQISNLYRNNGDNTFTEIILDSIHCVRSGSVAWGDYDNDGDLDILLSGYHHDDTPFFAHYTKIYKNNSLVPNTVPGVPTGLQVDYNADSVVLSWDKGYDNETPREGLTYNAYLYSGDGDTIWNSMADIRSGYRRIPARGNAQHDTCWTIKNLDPGQYFWSVQVIDHAFAGSAFAEEQVFNSVFKEDTAISLEGVIGGSVAWGDYDNDGDFDILLTGYKYPHGYISKIYQNNPDNTFTEQSGISLTGVSSSSVAWGDYDNDGYLDILLTGHTGSSWISKIYKNNGDNNFTEQTGILLTAVYWSSVAWGDYDNDGDLDILLTGYTGSECVSEIYKNNGDSTFTKQEDISLTGVREGSVAWGDYDNDGFQDILLTGRIDDPPYKTAKIYKNNGNNSFTEQTGISLTPTSSSSVDWGDYDNDGDLDILLSGSSYISQIFKNNGDNTFTEQTEISLFGLQDGSAEWGDYDNDGDLDILLTGWYRLLTDNVPITKVYENKGNNLFQDQTGLELTPVKNGCVVWGDYDNDGDLDILLTGSGDTAYFYVSKVYRNEINQPNAPPTEPVNISNGVDTNGLLFYWEPGSDNETPDEGLSYNLRVGTSPGGIEIVSPHSDPLTGWRRIAAPGDVRHSAFLLKGYEDSTIYWSVQSVDHEFSGSEFAVEKIYPSMGRDFIGLEGVANGSSSVGDYDNDNDLDILITGMNNTFSPVSSVYQNSGTGTFAEEVTINLTPLFLSSSTWGDYDNDGDLDILLTGRDGSSDKLSLVYQNMGNGAFAQADDINLIGVESGSAAWGDYDNDGDLDIILCGLSDIGKVSSIYTNNGNNEFSVLSNANLTGVSNSFTAWEDFDNDGDLDIILLGDSDGGLISEIYMNEGSGSFSLLASADLPGIQNGFVAFGDYDNDGDADLLLAGNGETGRLSQIHKNNGDNTFSPLSDTILEGVQNCSGFWADYDNDGDLDIVLAGESDEGNITCLYLNLNDSTFIRSIIFEGITYCSTAGGDFNNDGKVDLLISGSDQDYNNITRIYQNSDLSSNTRPGIPGALSSNVTDGKVGISWEESTDTETPLDGLSYNVYMYKQDGDTVFSSMSNTTSGFRKIPSPGNARQNTYREMYNLSPGEYCWSVQAIDHAYEGSEFAVEDCFSIESFSSQDLINLPGISDGSVAWGDYDNDDDLDILLTGYFYDGTDHYVARIYENDGSGNFYEDANIVLPGVRFGSVAWFDHNNDGNLDIILSGLSGAGRISKIFKNTGSASFIEETTISLPGISNSSAAAGDYNNDGYEDILLIGNTGSERIAKIYQNNRTGGFEEQIFISLPGIDNGTVQWGDYDNDSDLDILLTGESDGGQVSKIYQNSGEGGFTEQSSIELTGVSFSSSDWGDYDSDGSLDILITGLSASGAVSKVYQNDGEGDFIEKGSIGLQAVQKGASTWGDFDNNGDLDILVSGLSDTGEVTLVYNYEGADSFVQDTVNSLVNVSNSSVANGDYDSDGDLDILLTGIHGGSYISRIYKNNALPLNSSPQAPSGLEYLASGKSVALSWTRADDNETNTSGLSYNVYLYRVSGDTVISGLSNLATGFRKVSAIGNAQLDTVWNIDSLKYGQYHWSVQSVDNSYKGSEFAPRDSFVIETPLPSAENDSVCFNEPVPTLTVTGSNIRWYADAGLSTLLHSGNSFDPAETEPGVYTYYITQILDDYESQASEVTLTILALPPAPEGTDKEICYSDDISADLSASGQDLKWYDDALLTNLVNSGPTYETGLSEIGIYPFYVTQTVNSCEGSPDTVILMIHGLPDPIVMDDAVICRADTQYFNIGSAAVAGHSYNWVSDVDGNIGTDADPAVKPLVTTTYTLTETVTETGCDSTNSVTITINPNPEFIITAAENPIDMESSTSLSASDNTMDYTWSPAAGLSGTTGSQVTASPSENTAYTLTGTNTYGCKGYDSVELFVYCPVCDESNILVDTGDFSYGCGKNNVYMNGLNCTWTLYPDEIPKIYLYFYPENFDVAPGDWVIVYDGAQASEDTLGRFNNDHPPSGNIEGGSSMFIEFITDGSNTGRGFQAKWSGDFIEGTVQLNGSYFKLYPNPAKDILYIEWISIHTYDTWIRIYDNLGKLILIRKVESNNSRLREELSLKNLNSGIYYITVNTEDMVERRKIVKE